MGHESGFVDCGIDMEELKQEVNRGDLIGQYKKEISNEGVKSDEIKDFLRAQKELEGINFLKVVGHDPQGIMTYMIFGNNFPKANNDLFKMYIGVMIRFINSR